MVFIVLSMLAYFPCAAQDGFSTTGGDASGAGGSEAFSIGLVVFTEVTGPGGSASQGIEHAYEIFPVQVGEISTPLEFIVFPNPTTDELTLSTESVVDELYYQLSDQFGRILLSGRIDRRQTSLNAKGLAAGSYILNITRNGQPETYYKIIKK